MVVLFELGRHALRWRIVDIESQVFYPSERGAGEFAVEAARSSYQTSVEVGAVIRRYWDHYLGCLLGLAQASGNQIGMAGGPKYVMKSPNDVYEIRIGRSMIFS